MYSDEDLARIQSGVLAAYQQMATAWALCKTDWAPDGYDCLRDPQEIENHPLIFRKLRSLGHFIADVGGLDTFGDSWSGDADSDQP